MRRTGSPGPLVVGAAQAWTRRLFDLLRPVPEGVVAEDLVMVFRAIVSGGAATLPEPLVRYRRGGPSRKRRAARTAGRRTLAGQQPPQPDRTAAAAQRCPAGRQLPAVESDLRAQLARQTFIRDPFAATGFVARLRVVTEGGDVGLVAAPALCRLRVVPGGAGTDVRCQTPCRRAARR